MNIFFNCFKQDCIGNYSSPFTSNLFKYCIFSTLWNFTIMRLIILPFTPALCQDWETSPSQSILSHFQLNIRGLSRCFGSLGTVIPKYAMSQPLSPGFFLNYNFVGKTMSIIPTNFSVVIFMLQVHF